MKHFIYDENGLTFIEFDNEQGLKVTFTTLGAAIYSIYFNDEIMTLTPVNSIDFLKESCYYGKTIGPVCGRIKNGLLNIDNNEYHYPINEGKNTLHSGINPLSQQIFQYEIKDNQIIFSTIFQNVFYKVIYTVTDSLLLEYVVNALSATPIALTNHAYFCLGDDSIDNLYLKIHSHRFIEVDPSDLIPSIERGIISPLDFNNIKKVIDDINHPYLVNSKTKGYDHPLIFDQEKEVIIYNDRYQLTIITDYDSVLIYSDNYVDDIDVINTTSKTHRAIAIEPQDHQLKRSAYTSYKNFIKYTFVKR